MKSSECDATSRVPTLHLDSATIARGRAFATCQAAIPFVQVWRDPDVARETFAFGATVWTFDDVVLLRTRASGVTVRRTLAQIGADHADHCCFFSATSGGWTGDLGGRALEARVGQVVGLDLSRPFEARSAHHSALTLAIARSGLAQPLRAAPDLHGRVFAGVGAEILLDPMLALERRAPAIRVGDLSTVAKATLGLVGAVLTTASRNADAEAADMPLRQDVVRFVDAHLDEADLTPQRIADALAIGRTTLFRAMQPLGGVAAHVQRRRLEVIRALLLVPGETRSINDLAHRFRFAGPSHFAAAFKKAFGRSPRETRAAGRVGQARGRESRPCAAERRDMPIGQSRTPSPRTAR